MQVAPAQPLEGSAAVWAGLSGAALCVARGTTAFVDNAVSGVWTWRKGS